MNLISKLLKPEFVVLDLDVSSKKRVFEQVGLLFENYHQVARSQVYDCLFAREKLGSTALGHGIAIPHGRLKNGRETLTAFVRTREPIPFDAPDGNPVRLIFVVLVPEHATETHLQILSELAQMFSEKSVRDALLTCEEPAEAYRLLTEWSPYAPPVRRAAL
ncbi:MAG TPA: PTS IIA-like nitrogen regulatory protein PtsN [Burkholderiales bacterium]|nr:PTS IIA-like nitrogen regulatory protein PtsN [Burkholderiales bacterium]